MRKSDPAARVADRTELSRKEAAGAVDAVFESVTEALARREDVRVAGFGLFATVPPARGAIRERESHGGFDRADVRAGQGATRYREQRRLVVSPVRAQSRVHRMQRLGIRDRRCRNEAGGRAGSRCVREGSAAGVCVRRCAYRPTGRRTTDQTLMDGAVAFRPAG